MAPARTLRCWTALASALLVASLGTLPASAVSSATFSTPKKIGFGDVPTVASDGSHLYVATWEQWGGIYFLTNKSGTWKETHVVSEPKGSETDDSRPSIALDPKSHVYIAYVHTKFVGFPPEPKSGGIFYATNVTGSWVRHEVTSDVNDLFPSIAVAGGKVHIAFERFDPKSSRYSLFLRTIGPDGSTNVRITDPIRGVQAASEARPEITIDGVVPAIVYQRPVDGSNQDCGVWLFEKGEFTLLTAPPDFAQCHDAQGHPNLDSYGGDYFAVEAGDGPHVIVAEPYDPNNSSAYPKYRDVYFSNGQAISYPLPNGKTNLPYAFAAGKVIHTAWVTLGALRKSGTFTIELSKGSGGWSTGSLTQVDAPNCFQKNVCDLTPAVGSAGGATYIFFSRYDQNQSSKTYGDSFLYVTKS